MRHFPDPTSVYAGARSARFDTFGVFVWYLDCNGAVAEQIAPIRLEGFVERLLDDEASESGAIDDELDRIAAAFFKLQRGDAAVFIQFHINHVV